MKTKQRDIIGKLMKKEIFNSVTKEFRSLKEIRDSNNDLLSVHFSTMSKYMNILIEENKVEVKTTSNRITKYLYRIK